MLDTSERDEIRSEYAGRSEAIGWRSPFGAIALTSLEVPGKTTDPPDGIGSE